MQALTDLEDGGEVWVRGPTVMKVRHRHRHLPLSFADGAFHMTGISQQPSGHCSIYYSRWVVQDRRYCTAGQERNAHDRG